VNYIYAICLDPLTRFFHALRWTVFLWFLNGSYAFLVGNNYKWPQREKSRGGGGEVQWHQWSFDKNLVAQIHTLWNKRNDKIHHGVRLLAHSVCVSVQYLLFYFSVCSVKTAKWGHSEYSYHPNASGNNADYRGAGAQREIGVSLWQMQALSSSTECWRPWTVLSCPGHRIIPMYFGVNKFINYGPIVGVFCL
jgi:hypothetical protein